MKTYLASIAGPHTQVIISHGRVQSTEERFRSLTVHLKMTQGDALKRIGYELGIITLF